MAKQPEKGIAVIEPEFTFIDMLEQMKAFAIETAKSAYSMALKRTKN
jgi:hypothetical protein